MSCPNCGGREYRLIAGGVAECTGFVMRPTGAHPSGAMGPTEAPLPCRRRYQVPNTAGVQVPYCSAACGMQSVAQCVVCEAPLCLDHAARWSDGVLCPSDSQRRSQAAAAAEVDALKAADARLRALMRAFPAQIGTRAPEVQLRHRVDATQIRGITRGSVCPEHGPHCVAASISVRGRIVRKASSAEMDMPAWVLRHRCFVHSDIHAGQPRSASNGVELVLISAAGEIAYSMRTHALPVQSRSVSRGLALTADHPRLTDCLRGACNLRLQAAASIADLGDRIERVLAGDGRLGAEPCDP